MIVDIMMAFIMAILLMLCSFSDLKDFVTFIFCFTVAFIYIVTGWQLDFIGKMDFGAWIMFIIIFDKILMFIINRFIRKIKE